jgi:hypothetical protein
LKIIFLHGEIFEFSYIYIYIYIFIKTHFNVKWQGHKSVTHPLFVAHGDIIWFTWSKPLKWCTHPLYIVLSSFLIGPCCRLSVFILAPTSIVYYVLSFQFAYSYFAFLLNEHTTVSILLCCLRLLLLVTLVWTHHNNSWFHHLPNSCRVSFDPYPACFVVFIWNDIVVVVVIVLISKLMTKQTPKNVLAHLKSWKGCVGGGAYQNHLPIIIKVKKKIPQTSSQGWGELVAKIG